MKWIHHLSWLFILVACSSDDLPTSSLPQIGHEDDVSVESFGVKYLFSDSAKVTSELLSAHVIEKEIKEQPDEKNKEKKKEAKPKKVHYLQDGVEVKFINGTGKVKSRITSNEGIYRWEEGIAELTGNVVLTNIQGEKMETEQLFWDKAKDSVYTYKYVRIETPDKVIIGNNGMRANTSFTAYTIFKTQGEVEVEEE